MDVDINCHKIFTQKNQLYSGSQLINYPRIVQCSEFFHLRITKVEWSKFKKIESDQPQPKS